MPLYGLGGNGATPGGQTRAAIGSTLLRGTGSIRPMQEPLNPVRRSEWPGPIAR